MYSGKEKEFSKGKRFERRRKTKRKAIYSCEKCLLCILVSRDTRFYIRLVIFAHAHVTLAAFLYLWSSVFVLHTRIIKKTLIARSSIVILSTFLCYFINSTHLFFSGGGGPYQRMFLSKLDHMSSNLLGKVRVRNTRRKR